MATAHLPCPAPSPSLVLSGLASLGSFQPGPANHCDSIPQPCPPHSTIYPLSSVTASYYLPGPVLFLPSPPLPSSSPSLPPLHPQLFPPASCLPACSPACLPALPACSSALACLLACPSAANFLLSARLARLRRPDTHRQTLDRGPL